MKDMGKKVKWLVGALAATGLIAPALALEISVGNNGIGARRLHEEPYNLTGSKIAIGQVEIGRPGQFGFDKVVSWNPKMSVAGIFQQDLPASSNENVDNHASMVAMVMVSGDKRFRGVAPGARLYASAVGSLAESGQPEECLSAQHVAEQNSGDVRAINFSFGESLERDRRKDAVLDGNALLTQCIDWSSRVHDVLYVIAGNQGGGGIPIPTDHYNGITTAYTTKREGKFVKVDFANLSALPMGIGSRTIQQEINVGPRRAISLVAPGDKISLYNLEGKVTRVSGTSFAAPHITASVALLQEYGDRQLKNFESNWSLDSRRHEVMKAVLLNAGDKIEDRGDGFYLGMERTTVSEKNRTWLDSDAYRDEKIPLDIELGTGHLNIFRAYQQFSAGQYSPETLVANLGWDYNKLKAKSSVDYELEQPLAKDSFVSISLTWDRLVELEDLDGDEQYDVGETFRDHGLNNLDIYLMPADEKKTKKSVCSSVSEADSVEHIFCPVPETGYYKIRVHYREQMNESVQPYGLAWWTVPSQETMNNEENNNEEFFNPQ